MIEQAVIDRTNIIQTNVIDTNVIDLASRRPPVTYAVDVTDWWDGRMSVHVRDVRDDDKSRKTIAAALRDAADVIERGVRAG